MSWPFPTGGFPRWILTVSEKEEIEAVLSLLRHSKERRKHHLQAA